MRRKHFYISVGEVAWSIPHANYIELLRTGAEGKSYDITRFGSPVAERYQPIKKTGVRNKAPEFLKRNLDVVPIDGWDKRRHLDEMKRVLAATSR